MNPVLARNLLIAAGTALAGSDIWLSVVGSLPQPWQAIGMFIGGGLIMLAKRGPGHVDATDPEALRTALRATVPPPAP